MSALAEVLAAAERVLNPLAVHDDDDARVLAEFARAVLDQKPTKSIETCGPMIEICVDAIWTSEAYRLAAALIRAFDADREAAESRAAGGGV